jgi:drug/metabolite transporter (DMT)-like permease
MGSLRTRGATLVLLAALGCAAASLLATPAFAAGMDVAGLLSLRFGLAALALALLAMWRAGGRPSLRTAAWGLALGALMYAPGAGLYFASLTRLDTGMAALLAYGYPLVVVLVAAALGLERLTRARALAIVAALTGAALVLVGAGAAGPDLIGVLLAVGAAAGLAAYVLTSAVVVRADDPLLIAALVALGCALAFIATGMVSGGLEPPPNPGAWGLVVAMALVGTVVPLAAFIAGARLVGPSGASVLMTAEPLAAAIGAGLLLGQPLNPVQWLGAAIVLVGVAALARETPRATDRLPGGKRPLIQRVRPHEHSPGRLSATLCALRVHHPAGSGGG